MARLRWARATAGVVALGAVAALGIGCSSNDSRFDTVGNQIEASDEASAADADGSGGASATQATVLAASGEAVQGQEAPADRQVAYTASIVVRVDDPADAAEQVRALADEAGGYLARSGAALEGDQEVTLTLRVPADAFDGLLDDVAALGEVQRRDLDSEDVTDQVVDLEGRLRNAEASAQRIRELLAKAEQVQNLIALEDRLTERQTEIEALEGQLQVLDDRVQLATVDVTLTEQRQTEVSDDVPGPAKALRAGVVALVNVGQVLLAGAAFLLPFVPLLLLGAWLARRARRRRRAERQARDLPPPPAAPGPPPAEPVGSPLGGGEPEP